MFKSWENRDTSLVLCMKDVYARSGSLTPQRQRKKYFTQFFQLI